MTPPRSPIHLLPPEVITIVASCLDEKSLITATHVCYHWRSALISCSSLWSHPTFKNNQRTWVFLERSKSAPIFVDIEADGEWSEELVEALKGMSNRLIELRTARHIDSLDELLTQPLPILRTLDVIALPSARTSVTINPDHPSFPRLTNLSFGLCGTCAEGKPRIGNILLDFLRGCPLLEVAFFWGGQIGFTTDGKSGEAVPLHRLRSFTHETTLDTAQIGLFSRLSLPPACDIAFTITDPTVVEVPGPWDRGFPALHGTTYLPDVKKVEISVHTQSDNFTVVRTRFSNSANRNISLNRLTLAGNNYCSVWGVERALYFLASYEMARSVEILHFEHCPVSPMVGYSGPDLTEPLLNLRKLKTLVLWDCNPTYFLKSPFQPAVWCPGIENLVIFLPLSTDPRDILHLVNDIAEARQRFGTTLKAVSLSFQEAEERLLQRLIANLRRRVELVNVI